MLPDAWSRILPAAAVAAGHQAWAHRDTSVPPHDLVFAALEACPPDRVRVLMLGQDPYPTPGHAMGLAFSVPADTAPLPPSLRNMFSELARTHARTRASGDLRGWAAQGVLLLNRWLTLTDDRPTRRLWESFTAAVLAHVCRELPHDVAIVSWGRPAMDLIHDVTGWASPAAVPAGRLWLAASHPSPLGARRPCNGAPAFVGCGHFAELDRYLETRGGAIDWFR